MRPEDLQDKTGVVICDTIYSVAGTANLDSRLFRLLIKRLRNDDEIVTSKSI